MTSRLGGLGKGLGALIPTQEEPSSDSGVPGSDRLVPESSDAVVSAGLSHFREVPIELIVPNPRQPRQEFDEEKLAELADSIREVGVLQPVVTRQLDDNRYELVMGERRLRACRLAGLDRIPAIIRGTEDDVMLRDALLENIQRVALNPLEEAAAYQQLLAEFATTHDELAVRVGRSRSHVTNTMRLLQLPPGVQRRVAAEVISAGHARALLGLPDGKRQDEVATRIVAEGLSVRATEELVALMTKETRVRAERSPRSLGSRPELSGAADKLADRLETRVRVELGRSKGRIVVEFASTEDLDRIVGLIVSDRERQVS